MKSLDLFVPWIAPNAYGAPEPLIKQQLLDAAIEFCTETNIVQTVEVQDVLADEPRYDVIAPTQQELSTVMDVFYWDVRLKAAPADHVESGAALRAGVDTVVDSRTGTPEAYYQITPSDTAIYLWPVPDRPAVGALAVRASFEPSRSATSLDDKLYSYVQTLAYGTLARLLLMPGQPFTNPVLASEYERRFTSAIAAARSAARRGNVRTSSHVRPRSFC